MIKQTSMIVMNERSMHSLVPKILTLYSFILNIIVTDFSQCNETKLWPKISKTDKFYYPPKEYAGNIPFDNLVL